MSLFDDEKYSEMDWLAKVTEPVESILSTILASLPDEIEVPLKTLVDKSNHGPTSMYVSLELLGVNTDQLSYEQEGALTKCFKFEVEPGTRLDFSTGSPVLTGKVKLVKQIFNFEENHLIKMFGSKGVRDIRYARINSQNGKRAGEIAEILDCADKVRATKSSRNKRSIIANTYIEILTKDKWRIKSEELANKMAKWICDYISDGNMAAYTNLCKLKVMTYSEAPIYSIKEEQ